MTAGTGSATEPAGPFAELVAAVVDSATALTGLGGPGARVGDIVAQSTALESRCATIVYRVHSTLPADRPAIERAKLRELSILLGTVVRESADVAAMAGDRGDHPLPEDLVDLIGGLLGCAHLTAISVLDADSIHLLAIRQGAYTALDRYARYVSRRPGPEVSSPVLQDISVLLVGIARTYDRIADTLAALHRFRC
ncbi:hypothetical protein AB0H71_31835 [Nocardia sp. NPDC050697]|uniref:hypothetical protein n=1 Tax=Nocardia sp. NPDC050697 TaxID=3155158 RepID=UPI0033EA76E9